jgi:MFS family permease
MSRAAPRAVVTAVFFAFAIGLGLWAGSIPALMRQSGLDVAGLGVAITLHSAAYIAAMAGGGQLARRIAPRRLMLLALLANLPCFGLLFSAATPAGLMTALTLVGLSSGLLDLAMNAEGTAVEHDMRRPVLLSMHAAASAAFALGALAGSLIAIEGAPRWCALVVLVVTLPVALAVQRLGPRAPAPEATAAAPAGPAAAASPHWARGILRIGVVLGLTIGAEMAAQMWSARFLESQAAELAAYAGAGAAFFAGFQVVVRLLGDRLRRRLGDVRVILLSLLLAALGFGTVASSNWFGQSLAGFALVGLGTACVVPCCFALIARRAGPKSAAALGLASLVAGAIRLPTPLALGAIAAAWSDAHVFASVAAAVLLALLLARRADAD